MTKVDVVWLHYHPGWQNHGAISMHILDDLFGGRVAPLQKHEFVHHESFDEIPRGGSGVVVALAGMTHQWMLDIMRLNKDLQRFKWAIVMSVSDEGNYFKFEELCRPQHLRIWTQETNPNRNPHHRLMCGPSENSGLLDQFVGIPKILDWMFAGQVKEYRRRQSCVEQLRKMSGGLLVETSGFQEQKITPLDYYKSLASARIAPCPGGTDSPDAWRVWDAFNAGCIPILDNKTQFDSYPSGYWTKMFGETPPVPVLDSWDDLPALVDDLLIGWDTKQKRVEDWWKTYKTNLVATLEKEITELSKT